MWHRSAALTLTLCLLFRVLFPLAAPQSSAQFLCAPCSFASFGLSAVLVAAAIVGVAYARHWHSPLSSPFCTLPPNLRSASAASGAWGRARAQARLQKPLVILISSDGFRVDYFLKLKKDSHILRCAQDGLRRQEGDTSTS